MIYLWMTAGLVLLDQLVKFWAETQVQPVATIVLLPGLFSFTYAKNAGASFSMLEGQRVLFICITVLAVGALVWTLAAYREKLTPVLRLALFFVLLIRVIFSAKRVCIEAIRSTIYATVNLSGNDSDLYGGT